jgi:ribosomal protein S9
MMQADYLVGLPRRMGAALSALFNREPGRHGDKLRVVSEIQRDAESLPLDAGDDQIFAQAERAQRAAYRICEVLTTTDAILSEMFALCDRHRINHPAGDTPREQIARCVDRAWWIRGIRKEHARRFEHVAIRLGFTGLKQGVYLSHESAFRQQRRNAQNAKLLTTITLQNELGHEYTLAELAALGTANKAIRRGELMTRIRGFEEIAKDLGHIGLFATVTCPSKFHSVGGTNKKYNGATPREAQAYLVHVWALMRSACQRAGIRPYGFRIAEPHTDGCPHWHLLLFVPYQQMVELRKIVTKYAFMEDGDEDGAEENRIKLVSIEAGRGTAAGYIAKYVAKNIDGHGVGEQKTRDNLVIEPDLCGDEMLTPSQRVTYWSQLHGIRQFQQIGGAPIGVWRELRRIKAETVTYAPDEIKSAWLAVQKIESNDAAIKKQADFAAYIRSQGGILQGRSTAIRLAKMEAIVEGRYATKSVLKPCGVYAVRRPESVYESVRYRWTKKEGGGVVVAVPWTGVNNCISDGSAAPWTSPENDKKNFYPADVSPVIGQEMFKEPSREEKNRELFLKHRKDAAEKFRKQHLAKLRQKQEENALSEAKNA